MKNLRKALAAVIGLSVMAMSVSAFAEVTASGEFTSVNGAVSADYTEIDQNKVSATVDTTKALTGTEMTYLILNNNVTDSAILAGSIVEGDILYIDQKTLGAGNNTFTGAINLSRVNGYTSGDELPVGSYPIRVGYYYDNAGVETFAIATATMVVAESSEDPGVTTITIVWGDVDGNGAVAGLDVSAVLLGSVGINNDCVISDEENSVTVAINDEVEITDDTNTETVVWGDIDGNGAVAGLDVSAVLLGSVGIYNDCTLGDITITIGDECKLIVPAE
jgi:hypothetical protein